MDPRVTKQLISKQKRKTQLGGYTLLQQEQVREIKSLEIALRQNFYHNHGSDTVSGIKNA